ncbi:unnamed protein product [Boreogadus saida]
MHLQPLLLRGQRLRGSHGACRSGTGLGGISRLAAGSGGLERADRWNRLFRWDVGAGPQAPETETAPTHQPLTTSASRLRKRGPPQPSPHCLPFPFELWSRPQGTRTVASAGSDHPLLTPWAELWARAEQLVQLQADGYDTAARCRTCFLLPQRGFVRLGDRRSQTRGGPSCAD